jgi:hypothetical protein
VAAKAFFKKTIFLRDVLGSQQTSERQIQIYPLYFLLPYAKPLPHQSPLQSGVLITTDQSNTDAFLSPKAHRLH